jgi:uncharacterized membrane protein
VDRVQETNMPRVFSERSVYSLQRQVARGSHAQFFNYVAFAAIRALRLVARAYFMSEIISVIVKMMIKTLVTITALSSVCLLAILLNVTTPLTAGPFGILVIFIFAYLTLIGFFTYFLRITSMVISRFSATFVPRKPIEELSFRRSYYYSTIVALGPIMLIGLLSVGSIGFYEIILIIIFITIGCLYVSKRIN